ncbi:MOV34 MPN PAD-1 family protein [Cryptosporidium andersoni]|uniref:MOV34 MPN PAD-1 family protein n=1 Tax=Cryptosporidium andersoni TaxID=117008 RepID=A0A1J4MWG0_9CRYT|nr:MOV34 MPN PAD-1 family protein [Cryptosporidium andersoni]
MSDENKVSIRNRGALGDKEIAQSGFHNLNVVVHPIVLLSIVDHYTRVVKGATKRVVGTLLGEIQEEGHLHVTNCYALPFEEDSKDPMVWYLDHNYHEQMYLMFKKINTREKIIGWYSTGPKTKAADLEIQELFRNYCQNPLYLIVDVNIKENMLLSNPASAYISIDEPTSDKLLRRTFVHVPCTVGAFEAEEVGVEHLLRDIKNASTSTLAAQISDTIIACKMLISKLSDIKLYFNDILEEKIAPNYNIISLLQDIFNLLPDSSIRQVSESFRCEYADILLTIYGASCVRSVLALHNLINNLAENKSILDVNASQCTIDKDLL